MPHGPKWGVGLTLLGSGQWCPQTCGGLQVINAAVSRNSHCVVQHTAWLCNVQKSSCAILSGAKGLLILPLTHNQNQLSKRRDCRT